MLPATVLNIKNIPPQASQSAVASMMSAAATAKGAMQTVMLANTIVSVVVSGPLQQLLSSVKQL